MFQGLNSVKFGTVVHWTRSNEAKIPPHFGIIKPFHKQIQRLSVRV